MRSLLLENARRIHCSQDECERSRREIEKAVYFERILYTRNEFFNLVWMDGDGILGSDLYKQLTPITEPRTLKNLVKKIRKHCSGDSPHEILEALNFKLFLLPEVEQYDRGTNKSMNNKWFEGCVAMNGTFDARLVRELWVRDLLTQELEQSPDGIYYIEDGNHRALVYALNLEFNETEYIPVKVRWCKSWKHILSWAEEPNH